MVKFGRHQKFFVEENSVLRNNIYVVPYNEAKSRYIESPEAPLPLDDFESKWDQWLEQASQEFDSSLNKVWQKVFQHLQQLHPDEEIWRGASPEKALLLVCESAPRKDLEDLLEHLKIIHETSVINAEALRKLIKKYDKHQRHNATKVAAPDNEEERKQNRHTSLSCKVLPKLYAANFLVGLLTIQQGVDVLRSELGLGEYAESSSVSSVASVAPTLDSSAVTDHIDQQTEIIADASNMNLQDGFKPLSRKDSHAEHLDIVDKRRQEYQWLRETVQRIEQHHILSNLVAHRGFHSPHDRSHKRPLENSLQAYESAWTSGIHLCECDIALTKDEYLVLAHDEDFSRLALDATMERSSRKVRDLTLRELMSVALTSGVRPPLLKDVLKSAHAIGGQSQLIIEIKPGNPEAASSLAKLFATHPYLMAHCAVVMSFDSFAMHALQEEMETLMGLVTDDHSGDGKHVRGQSHSLGLLHNSATALTMAPDVPLSLRRSASRPSNMVLSAEASTSLSYPRPKLLVLTVSDSPEIDVELQVSILDKDVHDLIRSWTKDGLLNGVYMHYEPQMLTPEGLYNLRALRQNNFHVGIWGFNGRDPDDFETFQTLVKEGNVSFVNTDLPRDFLTPKHDLG